MIAVGVLLLVPGSGTAPLVDRDEPRFAQATREMIERGEFIVPYFNGQYRFDKPILIYWMMRASYAALGVNEFAARLPSMVCTIVLGLIVFRTGARWFTARAGFVAAFGLLTCVQMLVHGRSAVADMPMVLAVLVAQVAAFELTRPGDACAPRRWFWALYVALGLGFLAKGPVAVVVPALTWALYRLALWRKPVAWRRLRLGSGLVVTSAIVGAWGIPALLATRGDFWRVGMGQHVFKRGLIAFQGHGSFFLYYLAAGLISLFPWIAFAWDGVGELRRRWNEKNAFLCSWLLATYLLFSFYVTKLPHYVMPAFPAFFLILGQALDGAAPRGTGASRACFALLLAVPALAAAAGLAFAATAHWPAGLTPLRGATAGVALILLALAALAWLWRGGRERFSPVPLAGVVLGSYLLANGLRAVSPAVAVGRMLAAMPPETACGFLRFREPSLVFYSGRTWTALADEAAAEAFLRQPGPRLIVAAERETKLANELKSSRLGPPAPRDYSGTLARIATNGVEVTRLRGVNLARSSVVDLVVLARPRG